MGSTPLFFPFEHKRHGSKKVETLRGHSKELLFSVIEKEGFTGVTSISELGGGIWSAVFLLQPLSIIVKFPNDTYEAAFLKLAQRAGVSVPSVLGEGTVAHPEMGRVFYVAVEYIAEAQNPEVLFYEKKLAPSDLLVLADQVGVILSKLHAITLPCLGNTDTQFKNWGELMEAQFKLSHSNPLPTSLFTQGYCSKLAQVFESYSDYVSYTDARLVHGDANLGNFLVSSELEVLALIDPWMYTGGLPMYDLAYASLPWEYGPEYSAAVVKSYISSGGTYVEQLYLISLLVILYWENADESSHDVTSSVLDELFAKVGVSQ